MMRPTVSGRKKGKEENEKHKSEFPEGLPKGSTKASTRGKRVKVPAARNRPEYLPDRRNLVVSPSPPSDKIGIKSVQMETEKIVPMKEIKMAWVPYVPLEDRLTSMERFKAQIFTLSCTQRRITKEIIKMAELSRDMDFMVILKQILLRNGPYGFYIQLGDDRKGYSPKRATLHRCSGLCQEYNQGLSDVNNLE